MDIKASLHISFQNDLFTFADIGLLLPQVPPTRSKRQSSSTHKKSLEREQAVEPVKPAVPGGEPITLEVARVINLYKAHTVFVM